MQNQPSLKKTNDHLANERTFLAWLRTSIGIMGFGFVVVKFSMFVKQIALMIGSETPVQQKGYSGVIGIVLVAIGALVSLLAFIKYRKVKKQIDSDEFNSSAPLIALVTCCIVLVAALLIWYLVESIK